MEIWYYDKNTTSALYPVVRTAEERGINFKEINELEYADGKGNPDYFLINPRALTDELYWEKIGNCIDKYPDTKFLLMNLNMWDDSIAPKKLENRANLEFVGIGNFVDRMKSLLDEASKDIN